jgi:hypothetical protein
MFIHILFLRIFGPAQHFIFYTLHNGYLKLQQFCILFRIHFHYNKS